LGIIFKEIGLKDAFIIEPEQFKDQRAFFARSFSQGEFEAKGLSPRLVCDHQDEKTSRAHNDFAQRAGEDLII